MAQPIFQILVMDFHQQPNEIFPPYKPAPDFSKLSIISMRFAILTWHQPGGRQGVPVARRPLINHH